MAACWNRINKPSIVPRPPLSMLSSSVGNAQAVPRKRKNHTDGDPMEEPASFQILSSGYSLSSPSRPSRAVKFVPSIEGCSPLKARTRRPKLSGGVNVQGRRQCLIIRKWKPQPLPQSTNRKGRLLINLRKQTTLSQRQPKIVQNLHSSLGPIHATRKCPPSDPLRNSRMCLSLIYTPARISIYSHHGTTKSSLSWTKRSDVLTPLECPPDLCPFIYSGETIAGVENKLGRAFDEIITELARSPSTVNQELDTKLGSEGAGMLVEIARKRDMARWKSGNPALKRTQFSESPLFVTGTSWSTVSGSKTATPKTPRFHAREMPVTPSISRFQEELPKGMPPLNSKPKSPAKGKGKLPPFSDPTPVRPPPSSRSASSNSLPPPQSNTKSPSQPQIPPPPSPPPRPPPSSPNPKTPLKSELNLHPRAVPAVELPPQPRQRQPPRPQRPFLPAQRLRLPAPQPRAPLPQHIRHPQTLLLTVQIPKPQSQL